MPRFKSIISSALPLAVWFVFFSCGGQAPFFECTDTLGCVHVEPGDPLKIGVLQALSGKVAPLGMEQIRGIELAIDQKNGQVLGHSFFLQKEDTGCTSEGGANAVLKILADPQTIAIFGTTCFGAARTADHAMSEAGLVMISGSNSAPFLTSIGGKAAPDWHWGISELQTMRKMLERRLPYLHFKSLGFEGLPLLMTEIFIPGDSRTGFGSSLKNRAEKLFWICRSTKEKR